MTDLTQPPPIPKSTKLVRRFQRLGQLFGMAAIAISIAVLLGWIFEIEWLKSLLPGVVTMKGNTALGLLLGGISLWLSGRDAPQGRRGKSFQRFNYSAIAAIVLLGVLTSIEYGFGVNLGIDELLFEDSPHAVDALAEGRMAPNTAINFIGIGLALFLARRRRDRWAQGLATGTFFIAFTALLGHVYHITLFYSVGSYTGMAIHTAIAFMLLSLGVWLNAPDRGWMQRVIGENAGGIMLRRLLPWAILIPSILGGLIIALYRNSEKMAFAIAVLSVLNAVVFAGIIWHVARILDAIDLRRVQGIKALAESQRQFSAIFHQTYQFIGLLTPEGIVLEANQTALDFGGIKAGEVIGKPFWEARWWTGSPETQEQLKQAIARAAAGEFLRYEVEVRGAGNTLTPIDFSLKPIADNTGEVILLIPEGRDITQRKQAETALEHLAADLDNRVRERTAELATVNQSLRREIHVRERAEALLLGQNRILEAIAQDVPLPEILHQLTLSIESHAEDAICAILQLDSTRTTLHYIAAPSLPAEFKAVTPNGVKIGPNAGSCGSAAYRGEPTIACDIATDPRWERYKDAALQCGLRACWSVPIMSSQNQAIGTVALYYRTPKSPSAADWELIQRSIHLAGIAIESKQDKQALKNSEERFRRFFNQAPFPAIVHAEDGENLYMNQTWTELTGYRPEQIPTVEEWTDRAYGNRKAVVREKIEKLYELDRRVDEGEFIIQTNRGTQRIWSFSSAPLGSLPDGRRLVISMANDVTQRKHAEQKITALAEELNDLYQNAPCGYHSLDKNGTFTRINDTELQWLGYQREEIVGKRKFTDVITSESQEIFYKNFQRFKQQGAVKGLGFEMVRKDGTTFPVQLSATAIKDAEGNYLSSRSIIVDITQRKKAQKALQKSEIKFRTALDNIPDVFVIYDAERRFQFVNAAGEKYSGQSAEELIGRRDEEIWPPEVTQSYLPTLKKAVETRSTQTVNATITLPGVQPFSIIAKYVPMLNEAGEIYQILAVTVDISESIAKQQELAKRAKQQAAIAQLGQIALSTRNLDSLFDEMTAIVAENLDVEYAKILQLLPEENLLLLRSGVGWDADEIGRATVDATENSQASYTLGVREPVIVEDLNAETRFTGPSLLLDRQIVSGISVVIPDRTRLFGVLGAHTREKHRFTPEDANFLQAVSNLLATAIERQNAEAERERLFAELDKERSLFEAVLQQMPAGVGIAAAPSGKPILANHQVGQILGHPSQFVSLYSEYAGFHLNGEPLAQEEWPLARALYHGEIVRGQEIQFLRQDGSYGIIQANAAPIRDRDDTIIAAVVIVLDISDRFQAEAQVRELNATLEQRVQERTAELEEVNEELKAFSYSVSHDLRAPLRAMQGFAQALLEDYGNCFDELGLQYAERIVNAAERMEGLIEDLLTYSRLSRADIELQRVDLELVLTEICSLLESEVQERQAQIQVKHPLPTLRGHRSILVQVLTNLVRNAMIFQPPGTTAQVQIWAENRDGWIRLWIADNGIGIAPEHQRRIFQVFERLHGVEIYAGTGIGLAIVRKGMERLGGRYGVDSQLGEGSRFWIELPEAGEKSAQSVE
ncbi:PAS domain S-box protein [Phormidium sp. CCY1219]|uniref:PAS domain S-box protein n=1 Tax=Phormidium sp. CCY1219 TaxID=2886104 RepID=UPI002D1EFD4D|nr:PAS domain S-box protein [Phormidium sp. CCY1219]MEB3831081.1 PAS domain S-box protein [Phormidium sp. CCY1219]